MLLLLLPLLAQVPLERWVLEAEHARAENVSVLLDGTKSTDPRVQRQAVRALGRIERPMLAEHVIPLLTAGDAMVRREAINALGQMNATYRYASLLAGEKNGIVRGAIYETVGRSSGTPEESESVLASGLLDPDADARTGAARGLESWVRRNARTTHPTAATLLALRQAFRDNSNEELRELVLLALTGAGDRDTATFDLARRDASAQVRRLMVAGTRTWIDDPAPMVRVQAMRVAGTCGRAINAVDDSSEAVVLAATDLLGDRKCDVRIITSVVGRGRTWRIRGHALVSLAKAFPDEAQGQLPAFANSKDWHDRLYAATAAKVLKHESTLARLARDEQPLVAIEAMSTADDAIRALSARHAGLLLAAATHLKGSPELPRAVPALLDALDRLTKTGRVTVRDPRVAILERLGEQKALVSADRLQKLLSDPDPKVAALSARILSEKSGTDIRPVTVRYAPPPLPAEAYLRDLEGATAIVHMRGLGTFTIAFLNDEAPMAVATFAQLAEGKKFNNLTFHRIVANFVIQGGSPGADEYDALTDYFMRDEVGFARNARGTLGISTRGRDTGDGQIYVNTVDNFRLDHDYTVFARVIDGMNVVDRVQELDVIESIEITRPKKK